MNEPLRQRHPRIEDPKYLDAIRLLPCCVCGVSGPSDAAHIRMGGAGWGIWGEGEQSTGMNVKPDDWRAVPLCRPRYKPDPVAHIIKPDKTVKLQHVGCHGLQHGHSIKKIRELVDHDGGRLKLEEAFWRSTGKNPYMIARTLYEKFGTAPEGKAIRSRKKRERPKREKTALKRKIPSRGFQSGRKFPRKK